MSYWQQTTDQLLDIAGAYVRQGGVRVYVKTNLGPEIPVFTGAGKGSGTGGVLDLLGLKAAVVVRDGSGRAVTSFGTPPPTEPLRAALVIVPLLLVGFLLVRGALK